MKTFSFVKEISSSIFQNPLITFYQNKNKKAGLILLFHHLLFGLSTIGTPIKFNFFARTIRNK
ncbi:hypothetical protein BSMD_000400 [Bacillus subtilis Miyagi-4]|nr:hypothetical protein BSMD_000400 [Bacillus subtilis Miyagi-4]